MAKDIETGTDWLTRFGNWSAIDTVDILTWAQVWGPWDDPVCTPRDGWIDSANPNHVVGELEKSLFWNGHRFWRTVRVNGKLRGIFASYRWSGSTTNRAFIQVGFGYALNGRLKLLFRIQSDGSAAAGVSGPNLGQASGWSFGPH